MRTAMGEQPAPEAGVTRGKRKGHNLVVGRIHPGCPGCHLVLPDGHEGAAHTGIFEMDGAPGEKDQG